MAVHDPFRLMSVHLMSCDMVSAAKNSEQRARKLIAAIDKMSKEFTRTDIEKHFFIRQVERHRYNVRLVGQLCDHIKNCTEYGTAKRLHKNIKKALKEVLKAEKNLAYNADSDTGIIANEKKWKKEEEDDGTV